MENISVLIRLIQTALQNSAFSPALLIRVENLHLQVNQWRDFYSSISPINGVSPFVLRLRLLCNVQAAIYPALEEFISDPEVQKYLNQAELRILLARGFCTVNKYHKAAVYLQDIVVPDNPRYQFWYWSAKALIWVSQKNENCFVAFENAKTVVTLHEYGVVCLNQGAAYEATGRLVEAENIWHEALKHLELPSFALALTHYNLGEMLLVSLNPEAQHQFDLALKISSHKVALQLRSTALCGLGDWQRLHGHLPQAKEFYRRALLAAQKQNIVKDQINAFAKLSYLCLLTKDLETALEYLKNATALIPDVHSDTWVYTIEALVHLRRTDLVAAANALTQAISLGNIATQRARVIRAELERQKGNPTQALLELENLDLTNAGARETVLVLPELWAWAKTQGMDSPEPITEQKRVFKVQALDQFEVWMNQKKIHLTERSAELLVYLLHYKTRSAGDLISELYYEELTAEIDLTQRLKLVQQCQKNFNHHLRRLREVLQWKDVVRLEKRQYHINLEDAIWDLDWLEQSDLKTRFLPAIQRRWIQDIAEPF